MRRRRRRLFPGQPLPLPPKSLRGLRRGSVLQKPTPPRVMDPWMSTSGPGPWKSGGGPPILGPLPLVDQRNVTPTRGDHDRPASTYELLPYGWLPARHTMRRRRLLSNWSSQSLRLDSQPRSIGYAGADILVTWVT